MSSPPPLRLVGAHEIRTLLKVSRQRVHQITCRDDFPPPVAHLKLGKVWRAEDVDAWIKRYRSSRPSLAADLASGEAAARAT